MPNLYESINSNMKESKLNEIGVDGKGYRGMSAGDFFDKMFDEYVPTSGHSNVVGGEIVRAFVRINYRFYNDGDQIGIEYGNETCNSAARFLKKYCAGSPVEDVIDAMWGEYDRNDYESSLKQLQLEVKEYLERNPELFKKENNDDIFNYDEPEDFNYDNEDDEEW